MKKENSLSDEIRYYDGIHGFIETDKVKNFIKKTEEVKDFNVDDAVRLLNDTTNPNYWIIKLMWKFGRYQKYLQLKELAGKDLI